MRAFDPDLSPSAALRLLPEAERGGAEPKIRGILAHYLTPEPARPDRPPPSKVTERLRAIANASSDLYRLLTESVVPTAEAPTDRPLEYVVSAVLWETTDRPLLPFDGEEKFEHWVRRLHRLHATLSRAPEETRGAGRRPDRRLDRFIGELHPFWSQTADAARFINECLHAIGERRSKCATGWR